MPRKKKREYVNYKCHERKRAITTNLTENKKNNKEIQQFYAHNFNNVH